MISLVLLNFCIPCVHYIFTSFKNFSLFKEVAAHITLFAVSLMQMIFGENRGTVNSLAYHRCCVAWILSILLCAVDCVDLWYKLSKAEREKHAHVMKIYLLSPIMFGTVYQEDRVKPLLDCYCMYCLLVWFWTLCTLLACLFWKIINDCK